MSFEHREDSIFHMSRTLPAWSVVFSVTKPGSVHLHLCEMLAR